MSRAFAIALGLCLLLTGLAQADTVRFMAFGPDGRPATAIEDHLAQMDVDDKVTVVAEALDKKFPATVYRCVKKQKLDNNCANPLGASAVTELLVILVKPSDGSIKVFLEVYDLISGDVKIEESKPCGGCDKQGLIDAAETLVREYLGLAVKKPAAQESWIEVNAPEGAEVSVKPERNVERQEGNKFKVAPGVYQVIVSKPDHKPYETQVTVVAGKTETVDAKLDKQGTTTTSPSTPGKSYGPWKWVAGAGGAALIGAGVVGIVIDGPRFDGNRRLDREWTTLE